MSTGVVIPQRLRTSETLQQRVGGEHHVLDLLDAAVLPSRHCRDVLHDPLRRLGLAGTGLSRDDDALILVVCVHVVVCALRDGEYVGRDLQPVLALVLLEHLVRIDAQIYPTRALRTVTDRWSKQRNVRSAPRKGLTEMSTPPM